VAGLALRGHDMTVYNWSTTAASNDTADSTINWREAQAPSTVNDSARAMMAAIASKETAEIYGLKTIMPNIHDNPHNYTRFLIIGNKENGISGMNKCSIIFTVLHEPGSLVKALKILSDNAINLIKIESRPIHGKPFEYLFYVDFGWSQEKEKDIDSILDIFRKNTQNQKVLSTST
jgi:chorismate mutase/prephenate dehydratase